MRPGDVVTLGQARRLPDGAVVVDARGRRWTLIRPTGAGATRRWRTSRDGDVISSYLFGYASPVYLVTLPDSSRSV